MFTKYFFIPLFLSCAALISMPSIFNYLPLMDKKECDERIVYPILAGSFMELDGNNFNRGDVLVYDNHFNDIISRDDFLVRKNRFVISSEEKCIFGYYFGFYLKYGLLWLMSHTNNYVAFFMSILGEELGERKLLVTDLLSEDTIDDMLGIER